MAPGTSRLAGLRLITPNLVLRLPTREELGVLAQVAVDGVHPADAMPFLVAWTDRVHDPGFVEEFIAYHQRLRDDWSADDWRLELGVWAGERLIGVQALNATDFARSRTVRTGSWLGQRFQGVGHGSEMRAAVLDLAFRCLGARRARTGAMQHNLASAGVTLKLGYREIDGRAVQVRGLPAHERRFCLEHDAWTARGPSTTDVVGLDACRSLFLGPTG